MEKFFNLFSKSKPKESESDSKNKKQNLIATQNLQVFDNVKHANDDSQIKSFINNDANNNIHNKVINFTSKDFENIDKLLEVEHDVMINKDDVLNSKNNQNPNLNIINLNNFNNRNENDKYGGNIHEIKTENQTVNTLDKQVHKNTPLGDVVIVNHAENIRKTSSGFYTNKYKERLWELKSSNPILIDREKMRINFDKEAIDYLVSDMTHVFRERQYSVDTNQEKILRNIEATKELINAFSDLNSEQGNMIVSDFSQNKKSLINEINYIEVVINSLNIEVDELMNQIDTIDDALSDLKQNNSTLK